LQDHPLLWLLVLVLLPFLLLVAVAMWHVNRLLRQQVLQLCHVLFHQPTQAGP
jgi:hypothetical protein